MTCRIHSICHILFLIAMFLTTRMGYQSLHECKESLLVYLYAYYFCPCTLNKYATYTDVCILVGLSSIEIWYQIFSRPFNWIMGRYNGQYRFDIYAQWKYNWAAHGILHYGSKLFTPCIVAITPLCNIHKLWAFSENAFNVRHNQLLCDEN